MPSAVDRIATWGSPFSRFEKRKKEKGERQREREKDIKI
jgi:hypothetical protein